MAVTLYRQVGKGKARRSQKVSLGRGRRPADFSGPYFLLYSLADGTRPLEHVGDDSMRNKMYDAVFHAAIRATII